MNPSGALQHRPALAFLVMPLKSSRARRRLTARARRSHLDTGNKEPLGLVWNGPTCITPRGSFCCHLLRGVGRRLSPYPRQVSARSVEPGGDPVVCTAVELRGNLSVTATKVTCVFEDSAPHDVEVRVRLPLRRMILCRAIGRNHTSKYGVVNTIHQNWVTSR